MKSYRLIVHEAGQKLKGHEFGQKPKVLHLWNEVEWQEIPQAQGELDAQLSQNNTPLIRLYPALLESPDASAAVLREFGQLIKTIGGSRAGEIWEKKLDLPTAPQIQTARQKLQDDGLRARCKTYAQVKDSYPQSASAVDRLVFIHVANALLANNIPYADSRGVDIMAWGPTTAYCHVKKYHSLVPLVTAYTPRELYECFGRAFADMVLNDLRSVRESTVADGLRRIIRNIVSRLEPFPTVG